MPVRLHRRGCEARQGGSRHERTCLGGGCLCVCLHACVQAPTVLHAWHLPSACNTHGSRLKVLSEACMHTGMHACTRACVRSCMQAAQIIWRGVACACATARVCATVYASVHACIRLNHDICLHHDKVNSMPRVQVCACRIYAYMEIVSMCLDGSCGWHVGGMRTRAHVCLCVCTSLAAPGNGQLPCA